jgi:hypothetical protein
MGIPFCIIEIHLPKDSVETAGRSCDEQCNDNGVRRVASHRIASHRVESHRIASHRVVED